MKKSFWKRLAALALCAGIFCSMGQVSASGVLIINNNPSSSSSSEEEDDGSRTDDVIYIRVAGSGKISVNEILSYARDKKYKVPEDFISEIENKDSVSESQLKSYAKEYKLSGEFLQLFFKNHFVFKKGNTYEYIPVDKSLKKNNYNMNHLVDVGGGEKEYVKNGESLAAKGIDVSRYQGDINWRQVKRDGVEFAFLRLGYRGYTKGEIFLDEKFYQNLKGAQAAGVKVGVYFYSQAVSVKEAREEARFVLDALEGYSLDYPIVFDIESAPAANARTKNVSAKTATDMAIAFCNTVENAGYDSMIYSYLYYFVHNMELSRLESYDKWVANYYEVPFFPYKFQILQYTGEGKVKGINGDVDMNLAFTTY